MVFSRKILHAALELIAMDSGPLLMHSLTHYGSWLAQVHISSRDRVNVLNWTAKHDGGI